MTDFELASLYADVAMDVYTLFTVYYSIIFAFVVTSYFVARDLSRGLAVLVISLFVVTMSLAVFQQALSVMSLISLGQKIGVAVAAGQSDLEWQAVAYVPRRLLTLLPIAFNAANATIFFGAIYFFFQCRRGGIGRAA